MKSSLCIIGVIIFGVICENLSSYYIFLMPKVSTGLPIYRLFNRMDGDNNANLYSVRKIRKL